MTDAARRIADARAAIDLVATAGLSLLIRGRAGPVRDALLARLGTARGVMRLTAETDPTRLTGGIDAMASVAAGKPVREASLAERIDGRVLLVAGAERIGDAFAALLGGLIDQSALSGLVLLDEGDDEQSVPAMLGDRLTMIVDIDALSWRDLSLADPVDEAADAVDEDPLTAFCAVAAALGIGSLRAPVQALAVLREGGSAALAVRLSLAPRARALPHPPAPEGEPDEMPPAEAQDGGEMTDRLLDAATVALPAGLLEAGDRASGGGKSGSAAARRGSDGRGRRGRVRQAMPQGDARLDLVATLIAAAPMQRARGRASGAPIAIRRDDIRVRRPVPTRRRATIFAVDASGSAAVARLAEVKGAVERLLSESYVRRDEVGLIAFRGEGAETLLPTTRSLARARRELAALPGGGATPLASGIVAGLAEALRARGAGRAPLFVLLTDGGANIARDGSPGRTAARADAEAAAKAVAAADIPALVIDSAPRGDARVRALADAMRARYVALPRADDAALARVVGAAR